MSIGLTTDEIRLHDKLYADAWALVKGELHLYGEPRLAGPDSNARQKLDKAISLLERVVQINSENWNAMWALGKIYQRLDEHSIALNWFQKAHVIEPDNADILREATLCALKLGRAEAAVEFA